MAQLTPEDIEHLLAELRREAADTGGRSTWLRSTANTLKAEQAARAREGKLHIREEPSQWRRDQLVCVEFNSVEPEATFRSIPSIPLVV